MFPPKTTTVPALIAKEIQVQLDIAQKHITQHDVAAAIKIYQEILSTPANKSNYAVTFLVGLALAEAFQLQNNNAQAIQAYALAYEDFLLFCKANPEKGPLLDTYLPETYRQFSLLLRSNPKHASEIQEKSMRFDTGLSHFRQANLLQSKGNSLKTDDALTWYVKAGEHYQAALSLLDPENQTSLTDAQKAVCASVYNNFAADLLEQADCFSKDKKQSDMFEALLRKAIEYSKKAIAFNPNLFAAHYNCGRGYVKQGNEVVAIREFLSAAEKDSDPNFKQLGEKIYNELSACYQRQGQVLKSKAVLDKAREWKISLNAQAPTSSLEAKKITASPNNINNNNNNYNKNLSEFQKLENAYKLNFNSALKCLQEILGCNQSQSVNQLSSKATEAFTAAWNHYHSAKKADPLAAAKRLQPLLPKLYEGLNLTYPQHPVAEEIFSEMVAGHINQADKFFNDGNSFLAVNRPPQAWSQFKSATDHYESAINLYIFFGKPLSETSDLQKQNMAMVYSKYAATLLQRASFVNSEQPRDLLDKVIKSCDSAIKLSDNSCLPHYFLGQAYAKQGNLLLAVECFKQAMAERFTSSDAFKHYGIKIYQGIIDAYYALNKPHIAEQLSQKFNMGIATQKLASQSTLVSMAKSPQVVNEPRSNNNNATQPLKEVLQIKNLDKEELKDLAAKMDESSLSENETAQTQSGSSTILASIHKLTNEEILEEIRKATAFSQKGEIPQAVKIYQNLSQHCRETGNNDNVIFVVNLKLAEIYRDECMRAPENKKLPDLSNAPHLEREAYVHARDAFINVTLTNPEEGKKLRSLAITAYSETADLYRNSLASAAEYFEETINSSGQVTVLDNLYNNFAYILLELADLIEGPEKVKFSNEASDNTDLMDMNNASLTPSFVACYHYGRASFNLKRYHEAEKHLKLAVSAQFQSTPDFKLHAAEIYDALSKASEALGKVAEAKDYKIEAEKQRNNQSYQKNTNNNNPGSSNSNPPQSAPRGPQTLFGGNVTSTGSSQDAMKPDSPRDPSSPGAVTELESPESDPLASNLEIERSSMQNNPK